MTAVVSCIFAGLAIILLAICLLAARAATNKNVEGNPSSYLKIGLGGFVILMSIAVGTLFLIPTYNVWQKGKVGEAALAEATANRQILIQEASAKEEAAKHEAEAEIIRSKGIAKANEIVSQSLRGNSLYLQYLYIQSLKESQNKVIYVPISNEGLPILESARFLDDVELQSQQNP